MNQDSIVYWVPRWMDNSIKSKKCSQCDCKMTKNNIMAMGIRQLSDGSTAIYTENSCLKCNHREVTAYNTEGGGNIQDLCCAILEEGRRKRRIEKAIELREKSHVRPVGKEEAPISISELNEVKNELNSTESHEDFLKFIGYKEAHPNRNAKKKEKKRKK